MAEPESKGGRRNPLRAVRRSWRRFRRRPVAMQLRTVGIVVVVLAGVGVYVAAAPKTSTVSYGPSSYTPVSEASTSSRGVSAGSINVVFPVVSLNSLAGREGFANDIEFGQQAQAINLYVDQINDEGGINGRKINPIITTFDPTDEADMRALCKDWTEGSPAAFAVLDGIGDWEGDDELCIAQEGHTPFIGAWTTVTGWTNAGSPYLWWTGTDDAVILATLVKWGLSAHLLGGDRKVGVLAGNRASDQEALNQYLLPDLKKAGIVPTVETVDSDPSETATTDAETTLAIEQFKQKGIQSVIPLTLENVFFAMLGAEASQQYYPRLLLSDYESTVQIGLGLIPIPYEKELDGQEGITTATLGGIDDDRPQSQGGYDPGLRKCWVTWHKKYPQIYPGQLSDFIEEQGPIADWCQAIELFAAAARKAGPDLNRRTFVEAMASIEDFPGTLTPILSYNDHGKFYGPTEYQVVRLHNNVPPTAECKMPKNHIPQGTCWVVVQHWQPLATG